jgi:hypothetical protein
VSELPQPQEGAPDGSMVLIPTDGRPLFRLLKTTEGRPNTGDFKPPFGKGVAIARGIALLRYTACSHFLSREQAEAFNFKGSRVARVSLAPKVGHFARTGPQDGHVDVWARVEEFTESAEIEL